MQWPKKRMQRRRPATLQGSSGDVFPCGEGSDAAGGSGDRRPSTVEINLEKRRQHGDEQDLGIRKLRPLRSSGGCRRSRAGCIQALDAAVDNRGEGIVDGV